MSLLLSPVGVGGVLVIGVIAGYFLRRWLALQQKESIELEAKSILEKSKSEAKELHLEAKNAATKVITMVQEEESERKKGGFGGSSTLRIRTVLRFRRIHGLGLRASHASPGRHES